jgi:hypothetical protein
MEHLLVESEPANAKGVPVSLDTIDPNGNLVHIGDTTSDINGNYGFACTPEVPGTTKLSPHSQVQRNTDLQLQYYLSVAETANTPTTQSRRSSANRNVHTGRSNSNYRCNRSQFTATILT